MLSDLNSFLADRADLGARKQRDWKPAEYSLECMQSLTRRLGHPERRYPSLHVAGTNGKGSVCALASAALLAQDYRVGLYTSPHLSSPLDGIHLNGRPAAPRELEAAWAVLRSHANELECLTVFETVTALAFQVFADQSVDVAVIETGLGGRLDATNVINPAVAVITPIDLEHTHMLGDSLAAIAAEKGGIIKADGPVVIAPQEAEARAVLQQIAEQQAAPVTEIGADLLVEQLSMDEDGQEIRIRGARPVTGPHDFALSLLGAHQAINAVTAYAALLQLAAKGIIVSNEALRQGFAAVHWPSRLEVVAKQPVVLLDGAHTPAAARALAQALDDHFPDRAIVAVIGISEDKRPAALLEPLRHRLDRVFPTQSSHPRALAAEALHSILAQTEFEVQAALSLPDALSRARERARQIGGLVLAFGSVFLAEQARAALIEE